MRTFLGEILAEVGPATGDAKEELSADAFGKSFHRLLRLMDNLDYLYRSSAGELAGLRLATMDLDGLCRHLVDQAYPLLREAGLVLGVKRGYYTHYRLDKETLGAVIAPGRENQNHQAAHHQEQG